jgi:RNA polymerase sigma factor (sigma-70 family)
MEIEHEAARAKLKELTAKAIDELPDLHRIVMSLYYYEDLNTAEIAKVLRISEARADQIKKSALLRLQAKIGELVNER